MYYSLPETASQHISEEADGSTETRAPPACLHIYIQIYPDNMTGVSQQVDKPRWGWDQW